MNHSPLPVLLFVAAGLGAQTTHVVPSLATGEEGNTSAAFPFGYDTFRCQQILEASAMATPSGVLLTDLAYRANREDTPHAGFSLTSLTVQIGATTQSSAAMSTTYAANVTGAMTTVFNGAFQGPTQPALAGDVIPGAFNLLIMLGTPFTYNLPSGNLLIDITASGVGARTNFHVDAATLGGHCLKWGQSGQLSGSDYAQVVCSSQRTALVPGGSLDVATTTQLYGTYPGALMVGVNRVHPGFDLAGLGAPGNFVRVDPTFLVPLVWQQTFIGWASTFALPIPNNQRLVGAALHAQSVLGDAAANQLGLVTTDALRAIVGSAQPVPTQSVAGQDPVAPSGQFQFSGLGGPVVALQGTFF